MTQDDHQDVIEAIRAGNRTHQDVGDYLDVHRSTAASRMYEAVQDGVLDREKEGRSWVYDIIRTEPWEGPEPVEPDVPEMHEPSGSVAPVDREYDWDEHVPDDFYGYVPTDGEWESINAKIDTRLHTGIEFAVLVGGPTGCGKTEMATTVAGDRGIPMITIQMTYDMSPASLIGKPDIRGDGRGGTETVWNDGPLTKALLASREGPVVLLIDEANRCRPEVMSTLMSALDSRCEVVINQRNGERIRGVRENLLVISTINPKGMHGMHVQDMDFAGKRRLSNAGRYNVDYLGMNHPDREARVVADRTPAPYELAELLVRCANEIREAANDPTDTEIKGGVPTSSVISWAQSAFAEFHAGHENPVVRSGDDVVAEALYDEDDTARTAVKQMIRDHLDGCPFEPEAVSRWLGNPTEGMSTATGSRVECPDCGFVMGIEDYEDLEESAFAGCPSCGPGSHVVYDVE